jgi:hypothetical protein
LKFSQQCVFRLRSSGRLRHADRLGCWTIIQREPGSTERQACQHHGSEKGDGEQLEPIGVRNRKERKYCNDCSSFSVFILLEKHYFMLQCNYLRMPKYDLEIGHTVFFPYSFDFSFIIRHLTAHNIGSWSTLSTEQINKHHIYRHECSDRSLIQIKSLVTTNAMIMSVNVAVSQWNPDFENTPSLKDESVVPNWHSFKSANSE